MGGGPPVEQLGTVPGGHHASDHRMLVLFLPAALPQGLGQVPDLAQSPSSSSTSAVLLRFLLVVLLPVKSLPGAAEAVKHVAAVGGGTTTAAPGTTAAGTGGKPVHD